MAWSPCQYLLVFNSGIVVVNLHNAPSPYAVYVSVLSVIFIRFC